MEIEFEGGAVYRYFDVGGDVYRLLQDAPSKGRFVNAFVRDAYRFLRLN